VTATAATCEREWERVKKWNRRRRRSREKAKAKSTTNNSNSSTFLDNGVRGTAKTPTRKTISYLTPSKGCRLWFSLYKKPLCWNLSFWVHSTHFLSLSLFLFNILILFKATSTQSEENSTFFQWRSFLLLLPSGSSCSFWLCSFNYKPCPPPHRRSLTSGLNTNTLFSMCSVMGWFSF